MPPSTNRREPLVRNLLSASARLPQTTTLCHSVRSCFTRFLSRYVSLVARRSFSTDCPPLVTRNSGSAPRLPINITLFSPSAICLLRCLVHAHVERLAAWQLDLNVNLFRDVWTTPD